MQGGEILSPISIMDIGTMFEQAKFVIELSPEGQDKIVHTFDITGAQEAMRELADACNWDKALHDGYVRESHEPYYSPQLE